jgi:hypothetical protein
MTIPSDYAALKRSARTAGLWYLAQAVFSAFGLMYVRSRLVVSGDAAATAANILGSEPLFRLGIGSILIGQMVFIPLALALYNLFQDVDRRQARLLVALVIASTAVMFLITLNQVSALIVLKRPPYLSAFEPNQINALAMFFLDTYGYGEILIGLFWGLWLLPFGYLALKSGFIPRVFGILLLIACVAYLVDTSVFLVSPGLYAAVKSVTTILESVGEPLMLLWLVIVGARRPRPAPGA